MGVGPSNRIRIYQYDKIFNRAVERLRLDADISEDDKNCILKLAEHLLAKNLSKLRVVKYIDHLRVLSKMVGGPLRKLEKQDVEKLVALINQANYSEETKHGYEVILKKFFQWVKGCNEEAHES